MGNLAPLRSAFSHRITTLEKGRRRSHLGPKKSPNSIGYFLHHYPFKVGGLQWMPCELVGSDLHS